MEIELSTVQDREAARKYKPVIRDHRSKLREFEQALEWHQAGAADNNGVNKSGYNVDEILNDEDAAIGYGRRLQDETDAAADRAIRDLGETHDIAVATAEMVAEDTVKIANIDKNLAEIDDEIDRATRVLKRMGRRVMTDKYIWVLIFLIFAAITAIIVVAAVNGDITQKPDIRRRLFEELELDLSVD